MSMFKFFFFLCAIFTLSSADSIDIDSLLIDAKKSKKHILIFLHKPQCSYCERMVLFTLSDDDVIEKIKKDFIFVDINIGDLGEVVFDDFKGNKHDFAKSLSFNFYPSAVFIDGDGEVIYGQAGYKDEEQFLNTLRFVASHSYIDLGIDDFKYKE